MKYLHYFLKPIRRANQRKLCKEKDMAWWGWLLIGLGAGGGSTFALVKALTPKAAIVVEEKVITESKVGDKLADPKILDVPCSQEYIEKYDDLLCREMYCRMQQRGLDSKTGHADCQSISNMSNTLLFVELVSKHCKIEQESTDNYNRCFDRFNRILTTGKSAQ